MATNFLKFCSIANDGLALALAAGVGSSGIGCAAGRIYTGSGMFLGWAVALGSKYMGIGCRISFWGSSPASFPLTSSVSIGEFFSHGQTVAPTSKDSNNGCC